MGNTPQLLIWAHQGGAPHGHTLEKRGLDVVSIVLLVAAVVAFVVWVVIDRRARQASAARSKRFREAAKKRSIRAGIASGVAILVLLGLAAFRASGEVVVPIESTEPVEMTVADEAEIAIEPVKATAGGEYEAKVSLSDDEKEPANVQCTIDVLGADGSSVMTGSYKVFEPDGTEHASDVYATRFKLAPGPASTISGSLRLSAEAAHYEVKCWKVSVG